MAVLTNYNSGKRTWPVNSATCRESVILAGHFQLTVAGEADIDAVAVGKPYGIKRVYWDDSADEILVELTHNWHKVNVAFLQLGGSAVDFTSGKEAHGANYHSHDIDNVNTQPYLRFKIFKQTDGTAVTHANMLIARDVFVYLDMANTSSATS